MRKIFCLAALSLCTWPVLAQTPNVVDGGVINGASFAKGQVVTAGSLVSIFGTNLASRLAVADSIPLSTSLGGVTVMFNGVPAPLVAVIPGGGGGLDQLNVQVPWNTMPDGTTSGTATLMVQRDGLSSSPQMVQLGQFAPGIFSVQFGVGVAIAINPDGSLAAPVGSIPGVATHPAKIGDPAGLMILATGLGETDPPAITGHDSLDQLRKTKTTPTVLVGGMSAQVLFSGLSPQFPGVNQINIIVPANAAPGDSVPLQLQMGNITTTDQVVISIRP
jgi:uncharacterized protein (TIGR03437 family)